MKLFCGTSNIPLAQAIAKVLDLTLGDVSISKFSDGELHIAFKENIRNEDVFIIQSTNSPADNLMELFPLKTE